MDEYMDLRHEDDRANSDLHSELEFRTLRALCIVYEQCYKTGKMDASDWSALCFACGVGLYDFDKRGKR